MNSKILIRKAKSSRNGFFFDFARINLLTVMLIYYGVTCFNFVERLEDPIPKCEETIESESPSRRRTFSSVSKSLIMAQGMSKLCKRTPPKTEEPPETPPSSPNSSLFEDTDRKTLLKRVQFGEMSLSEDVNKSMQTEYVFLFMCGSTKNLKFFSSLILHNQYI